MFIKLIDKGKRFIKNWRPVSLLNMNYKIILKIFSCLFERRTYRSKIFATNCICSKRFMGESGRLILDIHDVSEKFIASRYLFTIDIAKSFVSLDHDFLIIALVNLVSNNIL